MRIGHGGFSTVYRAHQSGLDRDVAVKVLAMDGSDPEARRRFERECRLTGRLTGHPNVVTVLDSGFAGSGRPYLLMEFYPAGSLKQRVDADGPLSVPETLRLGVKLAGALASAHRAGMLHLDVKPQNVLLSGFGEPALADFGVARMLDATGTSVGFTPQHAAPELLQGGRPGVAADVYSLASTLYQALTGHPAFRSGEDEPLVSVVARILHQDPPPIAREDVPAGLGAVLARGMAKDPVRRFSTVADLGVALQELQAELGLTVEEMPGPADHPAPELDPSDPGRTVTRPAQPVPPDAWPGAGRLRRLWPVALLGAGAALLVGLAGLSLLPGGPAGPVATPGAPASGPAGPSAPAGAFTEAPGTVGSCAFFRGTARLPAGSTLVLVKRNLDNGDSTGYVEFVQDWMRPERLDRWVGHQYFTGAGGQHLRIELRAVDLRQALEARRAGRADDLAATGTELAAVSARADDSTGPGGGTCDY